ncbi:MAG: radical SAM protein [Gammaproteobacteria bacterium]|nr:radical SAM protein [Gammaproteobacteria bacterium]NNC97686.1 radical SAM protein [Gammaproteobacteria bacterium]NNM12862.1 radical SAM protein [Gammaproteobacteria bacterium]
MLDKVKNDLIDNLNSSREKSWHTTPLGDPRGYIRPRELKELWFHTGTACNLACPFCLEGSKPGDTRLDRITLEDVKPFVAEALELDVEKFSFTGGEPFIVKQMVKILDHCLQFKPCMVLTNGTEPVLKRLDQIATLQNAPHDVSFRISIDYPDQKRHDAGRGENSYAQAWQGLQALHQLGFNVSLARQLEKDENTQAVDNQYRDICKSYGLPEDITIVAFPDFALPGSMPEVPFVTESCMTTYQNEASRMEFMCAFSKMIIKKNATMRIYACTLVDDDDAYDQGTSLKQSLIEPVSMKHHRCYSCFAYGASCSES